jgi:hypothetical protein
MTTFALTGHMNLTSATVPMIRDAIRAVLAPHADSGLVGVSCLAAGADDIFADVILELGGTLNVILPAADCRASRREA